MKKQYVNGYGREGKSGEKWVLAALVAVCIVVFVITMVVAGLLMDAPAEDIEGAEFVAETKDDIPIVKEEAPPTQETVEAAVVHREAPAEPEPWIAPCDGGLLREYADNMPIYSETLDDWRLHTAIDISAPMGAEVRAVADGTVVDMYNDFRHGYTVAVDHGGGITAFYSNLSSLGMTEKGSHVKRGQQISTVGDTTLFETVADTHLHFEMKLNGAYVNPLDYFSLTQ